MTKIAVLTNSPILKIVSLTLSICLISSCNDDSGNNQTSELSEPAKPKGLGFEQYVAVPKVSDPLPAQIFLIRNDSAGRFYINSNPINYALRGINDIWKGTTDHWQQNAGDYTDGVNGYAAGDGPNPLNAANGQPSDYVEAETEIIDTQTWQANIQYVIDVTTNRTEEQTLYAFLDDIRSKNYSTIDGFGPLTEDFATNSGALATFEDILITDVTENNRYKPSDNDSYTTYGGQTSSTLGAMVQLAQRFRNSYASTSGPKYLFGTPRPWRMTDTGTVEFTGVETLTCIDGSSDIRAESEYRIDQYHSSVNVIPGLVCGERAHSTSHENDNLYTASTENRRKDNGYPSGHTNAGILASLAYAYALPERFAEHVARGVELGDNRVIAGMHSPVDVIGGRVQATMIAAFALASQPDEAEAAYRQAREYFGTKATQAGMSLYEYANQKVADEGSFKNNDGTLNVHVFNNNRFSDHAAIKNTYTERLTYKLPQTGLAGQAAVVPQGAEILLKTRQPYLTDAQRRAVLATTEVDSGYPLLDKTNGWGRLNLVAASDGYGAFDGDVHVTMLGSEGSFSAQDWWRNNISGEGMLRKYGTGHLTLTGDNTYSGGTILNGGILEATSTSAFGTGDLYITSGEIQINATGALTLKGNFTQKSGVLNIVLDEDTTQITIEGTASIGQGSLNLEIGSEVILPGDSYTILIASDGLVGRYSQAVIDGYRVDLEYTENAVIAHIL